MKTKVCMVIIAIMIAFTVGAHAQISDSTSLLQKSSDHADSALKASDQKVKEVDLAIISRLEKNPSYTLSRDTTIKILKALNGIIDFGEKYLDLYKEEKDKNEALKKENKALEEKVATLEDTIYYLKQCNELLTKKHRKNKKTKK